MPRLAIIGFFVSMLAFALAGCMCGHIAAVGLLGTVPGAALSWIDFITATIKHSVTRVLWFCLLFTSCVLWKNVHNVLWSGHTPLLG